MHDFRVSYYDKAQGSHRASTLVHAIGPPLRHGGMTTLAATHAHPASTVYSENIMSYKI